MKKFLLLSMLLVVAVSLGVAAKCTTETARDADATKKTFQTMDLSNCVKVEVKTTLGDIELALYNETPKHRDNFVKLVNEGYYDGVLFHRVIKDFMIQTGDCDSKNADADASLGSGDPGYTVEAEFVYPKLFHKKGSLAAARTGDNVNPERRSSGAQFYIVTGKVYSPATLEAMENKMQMKQRQEVFNELVASHRKDILKMRAAGDSAGLQILQDTLIEKTDAEVAKRGEFCFTPEQMEAYSTVGGTPHLDGQYTVFGEVTKGMDVVEKIQAVETRKRDDRPVTDVKVISMKIAK